MKSYYEATQPQREYTAPHTHEPPYAFKEELSLQLLFETGRQHGYAAMETMVVTIKPVFTTGFSTGSNSPRAGQERIR